MVNYAIAKESQGSVERANQDIQNMLITWMQTKNVKSWEEGLRFVQLMKTPIDVNVSHIEFCAIQNVTEACHIIIKDTTLCTTVACRTFFVCEAQCIFIFTTTTTFISTKCTIYKSLIFPTVCYLLTFNSVL